ncbi:MAG: RNA-binding S4 domain-containing protein [Clostridiales bacterium]|nr:RNA-binding S4 domain-containing protein [Clostridiales bacterium]
MRLDKFLKLSRVIKRRTVAQEVCKSGRVSVNGRQAKSAQMLKPDDIVAIGYGDQRFVFRVLEVDERLLKFKPAQAYEVINE